MSVFFSLLLRCLTQPAKFFTGYKIELRFISILLLSTVYFPIAFSQPALDSIGAEQRSAPALDAGDVKAFFDGLIGGQLQALNIAGATLAVVKDGKLLYAQGYGYADVDNNIPVIADRTLFRPGSISKLFTYTAVMQLVEQGKLDLDADVNQYLSTFKIPATYSEPVRVHHLLTHTAGFEDAGIGVFVSEPEQLIPIGDFLAQTFPERVRPPGQYAAYSNYGVALAGYLVEVVSGMPFDDYIDEYIFKPLQMNHSTFREPPPDNLLQNASNAYSYDEESASYELEGIEYIHKIAPAGGSWNTATDMANFMIAHLQLGRFGDTRILQEDTAKTMHSALYSKHPNINAMAHGFYQMSYKGLNMIGHGGDTNFFHSDLLLLPAHNVGVFISVNSTDAGAIRGITMASFLERYFSVAEDPEPLESFSERADRYVGTYGSLRRSETTFLKGLGLLGDAINVSIGEDNRLLLQLSSLTLRYVEIEPMVFQRVYSQKPALLLFDRIAFGVDDKGNINTLFLTPFIHAVKIDHWMDSPAAFRFILLFCLLIFFLMLISAFKQRNNVLVAVPGGRVFTRLLWITCSVNILFPVLFNTAIDMNEDTFLSPDESSFYLFPISLTMPLLSIVLTFFLIFFAVRSWRDAVWSYKRRFFYSLVVVASIVYLFVLSVGNFIGYHY